MSRHRYAILCLAHRPTKDGGNLIDTFMAFMEAVSLAEARGVAWWTTGPASSIRARRACSAATLTDSSERR